jgi:hypothetical protein
MIIIIVTAVETSNLTKLVMIYTQIAALTSPDATASPGIKSSG